MSFLTRIDSDEAWRREQFPVAANRVFLAHAAVTTLPRVVVEAMNAFNLECGTGEADPTDVLLRRMDTVRESAARLFPGAEPREIALLGPTSLGLSLVARGLDWRAGDEVIAYQDDYPANVYPWEDLERLGVRVVFLKPNRPGEITPELVAAALSPRTRLVALASCHFLSGYRIDIDAIGRLAHENGALFCLDAIQTAGAFPVSVEHVDFMSADSHKWMLGPMTAGVFYVAERHFETLRPALLGAWNVKSPNFIAADRVEFEPGARRYEPGVLNASGLLGMKAAIDLLVEIGVETVSARILSVKRALVEGIRESGHELIGPAEGAAASGITTFTHEDRGRIPALAKRFAAEGVAVSFRHDRAGTPHIRLSPHFYNSAAEIDRVLDLMG